MGKTAKTRLRKVHGETGSKDEDCYETVKKLVSNFEYSKSENVKKLSALAQILCFLKKDVRML